MYDKEIDWGVPKNILNQIKSGINYALIMKIILILSVFFLFVVAAFMPTYSMEPASHYLPLVSMQYRHTIIIEPQDLVQAKKDFPNQYPSDIPTDTLAPEVIEAYNQRLFYIDDTHATAGYTPVYPLMALPYKLILQKLGMPQDRCFPLLNATMVLLALLYIYKMFSVKPPVKLALMLLILASPLWLVVGHTYYELFLLSLLIMTLCLWYDRRYKRAAFLNALAGLANLAVMVVGIFMIIDWLINLLKNEPKPFNIKLFIKRNITQAIKLAVCFTPCFIQFLNFMTALRGTAAQKENDYFKRFFSYFFDLNLGFVTFAAGTMILFAVTAIICIRRKDYRVLLFVGAFFGVVAAYSFVYHINCGMIYCARYVMWSVAILDFVAVVFLSRHIKSKHILLCSLASSLIACLIILYNGNHHYYKLSRLAQFVLNRYPALYSPYEATFNSRVNHIDGGYIFDGIDHVILYKDPRGKYFGEVRKVLVYGNDASKNDFLYKLKTTDGSSIEKYIANIKNDGKYHYVTLPHSETVNVLEKDIIERGEYSISATVANSDQNVVFYYYDTNYFVHVWYLPFVIKPHTLYQIKLELTDGNSDSAAEHHSVDFYAPGYDSGEQKIGYFFIAGKTDYTFYINSGDVTGAFDDGSVNFRVMSATDIPLGVKRITINELTKNVD